MDRTAVFVDAGYLFAQGSTACWGSKKPRTALALNADLVIRELKQFAHDQQPDNRLLRIYWYDGAVGGPRPTSDQAAIAHLDDVKLRLGFVNSQGQQKGVDSLIVTDLIELARLKSISDAVLLAGDEDVRVGVQIAQNYGVRVHLLGISPSRGSQSPQLLQEADTTREWPKEQIAKFLSLREAGEAGASAEVFSEQLDARPLDSILSNIQDLVRVFVEELAQTDVEAVNVFWTTSRGVPPDLDKRLLPTCGKGVGRKLDKPEIQHMRACFQKEVRRRLDARLPPS